MGGGAGGGGKVEGGRWGCWGWWKGGRGEVGVEVCMLKGVYVERECIFRGGVGERMFEGVLLVYSMLCMLWYVRGVYVWCVALCCIVYCFLLCRAVLLCCGIVLCVVLYCDVILRYGIVCHLMGSASTSCSMNSARLSRV